MKSALPKVAHRVLGVPMVEHVVEAARAAAVERIVVVTGHGAAVVEELLSGTGVEFVRQRERLGTGHAVMSALETIGDLSGPVVILAGDVPLIRPETIGRLLETQARTGVACVVLSAIFPDPTGYGRIIRDGAGSVVAIIEHRDLAPEQLPIVECNAGVYCFDGAELCANLHRLEPSNAQGEYYLTDVVGMIAAQQLGAEAVVADDVDETHGINSRVQLADVTKVLQRRINERHMRAGVTITDPALAWIGPQVEIGRDTVIEPMTFLTGATRIAGGCIIGPESRITASVIGEGSVIDSSIVLESRIGDRVTVGPRAYLRPGTEMAEGSKAGMSVEIKNSRVGAGSKVPHLSYIGDAEIGANANIGAGTITCNYDGHRKHRTIVGDGAFVGSDTMLIAPVEIGAGAVVGAGSAIARDVPADALALERAEQRTVEGWAARKRADEQGET
jgi:bifunctional UDP-N-acetylglucosamine pyrophosphorylase/glucosamine-1-phosphate N-acetyltransferase